MTTLDKLTYAGPDGEPARTCSIIRGTSSSRATSPTRRSPARWSRRRTIVVHFAAETHVDRSILNAGEFITTDVFGTFVLLEAAREAKSLRKFVQISTDEVYGSVPEGSSRETDELRPRNPYSASKAGADRLAYSYWATYERAGRHQPRLEQLRPESVSREGDPALHHQRDGRHARCRSTATA